MVEKLQDKILDLGLDAEKSKFHINELQAALGRSKATRPRSKTIRSGQKIIRADRAS